MVTLAIERKRRCLYCQRCEARKLADQAFDRLMLPAVPQIQLGLLFAVESAMPQALRFYGQQVVTAAVAGVLSGDKTIELDRIEGMRQIFEISRRLVLQS